MAQRASNMGLTLVLFALMWAYCSAQLPCQPSIVSLQSCIGFITSNSSTPSPQCCTQLASLVQTQAQCMCALLNVAPQLPIPINRTQAITLPGACNIQAPPLSQCNAPAGIPTTPSGPLIPTAGSPQEAPAPTSPATPSDATAPPAPSTPSTTAGVPASKGGSKAGATTKGPQSSSATKFTPSFFFFFFTLVVSAISSF
ncbi:non-specific lipid-transfer protein-like protein At2g13820 [Asparagus officinalis]|uniref:non-specific lipid-transfer protein-like protein At2g13820 n=1 Tax=Asparagus officinalis TaxID=4686 RepID=UPI00098E19F9|nr:non-specific lipid-transfer protein-like protein At2g13820 [Asparagus officinalis]